MLCLTYLGHSGSRTVSIQRLTLVAAGSSRAVPAVGFEEKIMRGYRSAYAAGLFLLCTLLSTFSARADCPVSVSVGGRDAHGVMPVTVSTQGGCGASSVSLLVDGYTSTQSCSSPTPSISSALSQRQHPRCRACGKLVRTRTALQPSGCDPATDSLRCRQTTEGFPPSPCCRRGRP